MQAVVKIGSTQFLVSKDQEVLADALLEKKESMSFDEVLLIIDDKNVTVGTPFVPNAKVKAKVLVDQKGEKIRVSKFKAKSRYHKVRGFRSKKTKLLITDIITK